MIILIDCHYIKVFPHFPWYCNLHTDTYLISELQYPFIGVLECKFNLDELLQVNYELTIMRIKHGFPLQLEKVDLVITYTPAFQMFIQKPLKSLSSKKKKGHNSWTVNVNFTIIEINLYFMVHRTLNTLRKPRKSLFSKRKKAIAY